MSDQSFIQAIIARLRPEPKPTAQAVPTKAQQMPAGPQLRGWQLANQERQAMGDSPVSYAEWVKTATPLYEGSK